MPSPKRYDPTRCHGFVPGASGRTWSTRQKQMSAIPPMGKRSAIAPATANRDDHAEGSHEHHPSRAQWHALVAPPVEVGGLRSSTRIVMMTAKTPSENALRRSGIGPTYQYLQRPPGWTDAP